MASALNRVPDHLKKYVVEQNYDRYTPEDQAAWRFIMRQLKDFLSTHAHSCYVEGLKKSGIEVDHLPRIEVMNDRLETFGWGAIPVSGFIPPAAFMEFQSLGLLPIASDMRSIDHLAYTPAPDIVHEAAGHAPILVQPEFAAYLKKYAEVARNAIITLEDMNQYAAIRELSDIKENPDSTLADTQGAEKKLELVNSQLKTVSEAGWLSRMNWWTAEYGLIGSLEHPLIYGAGLLSSVGESRHCLEAKVRKLPLSIDCIQMGYDITEPQPQLYVTPDFQALGEVLEDLAQLMAFRRGGVLGLERARQARTVNTVVLDSGLQISGQLESFRTQGPHEAAFFLKFSGPSALSHLGQELQGHGIKTHSQGFSSPLGRIKRLEKPLHAATDSELNHLNLIPGRRASIEFESGVLLRGEVLNLTRLGSRIGVIQFRNAEVRWMNEVLFDPDWGDFDLAVGDEVVSVFGGPADRIKFGQTDDFVASRVPARRLSEKKKADHAFFQAVRSFRDGIAAGIRDKLHIDTHGLFGTDQGDRLVQLAAVWLKEQRHLWLAGLELLEMAEQSNFQNPIFERIHAELNRQEQVHPELKEVLSDGFRLLGVRL